YEIGGGRLRSIAAKNESSSAPPRDSIAAGGPDRRRPCRPVALRRAVRNRQSGASPRPPGEVPAARHRPEAESQEGSADRFPSAHPWVTESDRRNRSAPSSGFHTVSNGEL